MKIAVITGAVSGIANAVAKKLQKDGCKIIALDKNIDNIKEDNDFIYYSVDVTKSHEVNKVFEKINEEFGKVDILVNTVGATLHTKLIDRKSVV